MLTFSDARIVAHSFAGRATWDVSNLIRVAANVGARDILAHRFIAGRKPSLHAINGCPC